MAGLLLVTGLLLMAGCAHPGAEQIESYVQNDTQYADLPWGPPRVDALFMKARQISGSNYGALALLGSVAIRHGIRLEHPFNTGLLCEGPLAPADKCGHFFAHAWWEYQDRSRLIPQGKALGYIWEVIGEVRSWVSSGSGFDWDDIWANRVGCCYAEMLYEKRHDPDALVLPSVAIAQADACRPPRATKTPPATR